MVLPQGAVAKPTQGALQLAGWLRGACTTGPTAGGGSASTASSLALVAKAPMVEAPEVARARERAKRAKDVVALAKKRAAAVVAKQAVAANKLREVAVVATQSQTKYRRWCKSSDTQSSNIEQTAVKAPNQENIPLSSSKQAELEDRGAASIIGAKRKPATKERNTQKRQRVGRAPHMSIPCDSGDMEKALAVLCDIVPPIHN